MTASAAGPTRPRRLGCRVPAEPAAGADGRPEPPLNPALAGADLRAGPSFATTAERGTRCARAALDPGRLARLDRIRSDARAGAALDRTVIRISNRSALIRS